MIGVRTDLSSESALMIYTRFTDRRHAGARDVHRQPCHRIAAPATSANRGPSRSCRIRQRRIGESRAALSRRPLLGFAFVLPIIFFTTTATCSTSAFSFLTYVMLGWGLNIVVGLAGLLDLGYVAFYAVGAYSLALFGDDL